MKQQESKRLLMLVTGPVLMQIAGCTIPQTDPGNSDLAELGANLFRQFIAAWLL